jgi:phenylpropionate dioxygenase-like ring-hydroxylating dioxygenase large terminal subunit
LRYPELGTGPLPHAPNTSAAYFEKEREKLFKRTWLLLCRDDELPRPGSYVVKQVAILETSVLLVRGEDNVIRAFHNSCRHRGNKVVMGSGQKSGDGKGFICGFHGWTYDLEGRLRYVPDEGCFIGLDKAANGLSALGCDVWEGFVFVHANPTPQEPLHAFMGEVADLYDGYFDALDCIATYRMDLAINWKLFVDVSVEGYHGAYVHGNNIARQFIGKDNPTLHLPSKRLYTRHRTVSIPADFSREVGPVEWLSYMYGVASSYTPSRENNRTDDLPPGVNPDRVDPWAFDILSIHPNTIILTGRGVYITMYMWPSAADRTRCDIGIYMPRADTLAQRCAQEYTVTMLRDVMREDADTLEPVQRGMASGALEAVQLSDEEIASRHVYQSVLREVRGACERGAAGGFRGPRAVGGAVGAAKRARTLRAPGALDAARARGVLPGGAAASAGRSRSPAHLPERPARRARAAAPPRVSRHGADGNLARGGGLAHAGRARHALSRAARAHRPMNPASRGIPA